MQPQGNCIGLPAIPTLANALQAEMHGGAIQNAWQPCVSPKSRAIWLQVVAGEGTDAIPAFAATCISVNQALGNTHTTTWVRISCCVQGWINAPLEAATLCYDRMQSSWLDAICVWPELCRNTDLERTLLHKPVETTSWICRGKKREPSLKRIVRGKWWDLQH